MKGIGAVTVLLVLLSGPVLCFVLACPAHSAMHSCCPRGGALAACPYDFLTTPSRTVRVHNYTGLIVGPVQAERPVFTERQGHANHTVVADGRNLHVLNRILRI